MTTRVEIKCHGPGTIVIEELPFADGIFQTKQIQSRTILKPGESKEILYVHAGQIILVKRLKP